MDEACFVAAFGAVFEHSPWVAAAVHAAGGARFAAEPEALADLFEQVVMNAPRARQLALIRAHPQLAVGLSNAAGLTAASRAEQSGAGLDQCSPAEFGTFRELNAAYLERFGFPFILAVRGLDRDQVLQRLRARVGNDAATEFSNALREVCRIGRLRLRERHDG